MLPRQLNHWMGECQPGRLDYFDRQLICLYRFAIFTRLSTAAGGGTVVEHTQWRKAEAFIWLWTFHSQAARFSSVFSLRCGAIGGVGSVRRPIIVDSRGQSCAEFPHGTIAQLGSNSELPGKLQEQ